MFIAKKLVSSGWFDGSHSFRKAANQVGRYVFPHEVRNDTVLYINGNKSQIILPFLAVEIVM